MRFVIAIIFAIACGAQGSLPSKEGEKKEVKATFQPSFDFILMEKWRESSPESQNKETPKLATPIPLRVHGCIV
jgi:hypothetical protein